MGLEILIVDDEVEFAEAFAERLRLRGFTAHIAHSGEQALQIVDQGDAKIMVLDLRMPGMDGLEVLRRVKKTHPEVEVIILSGHGSEMDEVLCPQSWCVRLPEKTCGHRRYSGSREEG